jgi:hypothetical protein
VFSFHLQLFSTKEHFSETPSQVYVKLNVKYLLHFSDCIQIEFSQHIWVKRVNMKFYENMSHCINLLILSVLTQNFEGNC